MSHRPCQRLARRPRTTNIAPAISTRTPPTTAMVPQRVVDSAGPDSTLAAIRIGAVVVDADAWAEMVDGGDVVVDDGGDVVVDDGGVVVGDTVVVAAADVLGAVEAGATTSRGEQAADVMPAAVRIPPSTCWRNAGSAHDSSVCPSAVYQARPPS